LNRKLSKTHPIIKQAFSEYKKEIARLQKQLVKEQIAHQSEIERMKAEFEEQIQSMPGFNIQLVSPSKDK
jgi:TPP-dependent pyruvate/acetoin dehydrogenase alpha subunit